MNVLLLQVFVSLMLVLGSVLALLYSVKQADHEHSDRLSLLPLEDDYVAHAVKSPATAHHTRRHTPAAQLKERFQAREVDRTWNSEK